MKKRFSKSFLFTLAVLIPLVLLAQNSGPQNYATVIMTFLRAQTAAAARSAIGAGTGGVGSESINFNSTQFTVGAVTNVTIVSGVITTNAVMKGSTSGTITVGATGGIVSSGNTNGFGVASPVTEMHVGSTSTSSPRGIMSAQYSTGTDGAQVHMRKARGTEASPTVVVTGDDLGRLQWSGYDGNSYEEMASIRAAATGTIADTRLPTQLIFSTATDADPSVLTDRMYLTAAGSLGIRYSPTSSSHLIDAYQVTGFPTIALGDIPLAGAPLLYLQTDVASGYGILETRSSHPLVLGAADVNLLWITTGGGIGIRTTTPGSFGLAINHATGQALDLIYNDSDGSPANHATLTVGATGNLTIAPSGGVVSITGAIAASTDIVGGASSLIYFSSRTVISSPVNGNLLIRNNGGTDFGVMQLGGTTSSFPAIKRSSTTAAFRLADDSADAPITASNGTFSGYIVGGVQSLSGAGAVNVTQAITEVTTTGAAQALTLADGVAGQEKTIIHGVDGGSAVLTPTTKTGWSTCTFTAAGESLTLVFLATRGWCVKSSYLAVVAP